MSAKHGRLCWTLMAMGSLFLASYVVKASQSTAASNKPQVRTPTKDLSNPERQQQPANVVARIPWSSEDYESLARNLSVRPPTHMSPFLKLRVNRWMYRRLFLFVQWFDPLRPRNSSLSQLCLWWKAMAGNDHTSPAHDGYLQYDLLPSHCRWIISPWIVRKLPRLIQTNIEIRMAFLERSLRTILEEVKMGDDTVHIRLVTVGGGYDVRSVRYMNANLVDEAIELDLPSVVACKERLFQSKRFQRRRPNYRLPKLCNVNLNDIDQVERTLKNDVLANDTANNARTLVTIFLFEGVMIYLNDGIPSKLLSLCSDASRDGGPAFLCFADRLGISGNDKKIAVDYLRDCDWELEEWLPKPGAARHMGWARRSLD